MSISVWGFALSRGPWKVSDISSEQMSGQAFRTHQGQVGAFEMDLNVPLHMVPSNPQIYLESLPCFPKTLRTICVGTNYAYKSSLGSGGALLKYLNLL